MWRHNFCPWRHQKILSRDSNYIVDVVMWHLSLTFLLEKLSKPWFCKDLASKTAFFKGWSWFKLNNLGLALGEDLKFYTSVAKALKLKARKFWRLIPTFVKVTGEKLVEGTFCSPPILNRVKKNTLDRCFCHSPLKKRTTDL